MPKSQITAPLPGTQDVEADLSGRSWTLRANERVLSNAMAFLSDGTLAGYDHPNERYWNLEGAQLQFLDTQGRVTSRLDPLSPTMESLGFTGKSLIDPSITFTVRPMEWADRGRPANLTRSLLAADINRYGWRIGDHTYGHPLIHDRAQNHLEIGKFCSIAANVGIALGNHRMDTVSSYPFATLGQFWPSSAGMDDHESRGAVTIGSDVWLGASAFILSGVSIGHGAVVAAHSVVTKDVPPYAIIAGNPARILKYRFPPETVERLLAVAWWEWADEEIDSHLPLMLDTDLEEFLKTAETGATSEDQKTPPFEMAVD